MADWWLKAAHSGGHGPLGEEQVHSHPPPVLETQDEEQREQDAETASGKFNNPP